MDTRLLRSFLAVARLNSFTEAALELGYTQSTITGHMQKLERELNTTLLDRLPTGVQVTDVGARLVPRAEDVLTAQSQLKAVSSPDAGQVTGTVRIMAPESLCTYRLPEAVTALHHSAPGVDIWLTPGGIAQAIDDVQRGRVDLALTMEPRLPASELAAEHLGHEPLVLLGGPHESHGAALTWGELASQDSLLIDEGCGYSDDIAARLRGVGEASGRRSHFGSIEAIKRCVAVGLGWTALPAITAADQIDSGALQVLEGPSLPDCDVHAVTHPRRYLSPAVRTVLDQLRRIWRPTAN